MMLTFDEVRRLLPQQFPVLMVDRVLDYEAGKSLTATKCVSGNEIHFLGHFQHFSVMPGVFVLEGMAQGCLILFQLTYGALPRDEVPLYGSVNAKFQRVVTPGDLLVYEVEAVKLTSYAGIFKVVATVNSEPVAKAELALGGRRRDRLGAESAGAAGRRAVSTSKV